jgi:hypothetical protein
MIELPELQIFSEESQYLVNIEKERLVECKYCKRQVMTYINAPKCMICKHEMITVIK